MTIPYCHSRHALVALLCSLVAAGTPVIVELGGDNEQARVAAGVPKAPQEGLVRAFDHDSASDGMSAVVSSNGVKFIGSRRSNRRNDDTANEGQLVDAAKDVRKAIDSWSMPTLPGSTFFTGQPTTPVGEIGENARRANAIYFGIGIGTFLLALALIQVVLRKLNFLEVPEEPEDLPQESGGNPQDMDAEPAGVLQDEAPMELRMSSRASMNPEHPGNHVQFRMQQVLVAWLFIVASTSFFCDYLASQAGFDKARHYFGMAAAFLWLIGFLIHFHWQLTIGSSRTQLFAAFFKVKACIMIQVHPFCMIVGMSESDPIVWWPGFAGLALWHTGNIISCFDYFFNPPRSSDRKASWLAYGNLSVTELVIDTLATKLLCIASICVTHWWGDPKNQLVNSDNYGVIFCEFGGAFMFMLASCVKCEWCNGFRNCSHATAGSRGSHLLGPGARTGARPKSRPLLN